MPIRVGHERNRNKYQVECGCGERDPFPGPIAVAHQRRVQNDEGDENCHPWRYAEETQARSNGNELGDKSEEVPDCQVDHRKPSPEWPEAVEDQLRVPAMG